MKRKMEDIPVFGPSEWLQLAYMVIRATKKLVRDKKYFKGTHYTADYADKKAKRQAAPKGQSQASVSTVPDLTLTGKMLDGFLPIGVRDDGIVVGWDAQQSKKVKGNASHGRDLSPDKLGGLLAPINTLLDKKIDELLQEHSQEVEDVKTLHIGL